MIVGGIESLNAGQSGIFQAAYQDIQPFPAHAVEDGMCQDCQPTGFLNQADGLLGCYFFPGNEIRSVVAQILGTSIGHTGYDSMFQKPGAVVGTGDDGAGICLLQCLVGDGDASLLQIRAHLAVAGISGFHEGL